MRKLIWLSLIAMILIFSYPAIASDWPMKNGDIFNSRNVQDSIKPPLEIRWFQPGGNGNVITEGFTVYKFSGGELCAVDLVSSKRKWSIRFEDDNRENNQVYYGGPNEGGWTAAPVVKNGIIYVGARWHLYAVKDQGNKGTVLWKTQINSQTPLVFANSTLYGVDEQYYLKAYDIATGKNKWGTQKVTANKGITVANGKIFASESSVVYAFIDKGKSATKIWSKQLSPKWGRLTQIAYKDHMLFTGLENKFYALNPSTGTIIWSTTLPSKVTEAPAIGKQFVYLNLNDGSTVALDMYNGKIRWKVAGQAYGSPLVVGDIVYICGFRKDVSNGGVIWIYFVKALNAFSGKNLDTIYMDGNGPGSLAAAKNFILVNNGEVLTALLPKSQNIKVLLNQDTFSGGYPSLHSIEFNRLPLLTNGRVLVPMRVLFETLGAKVDWDGRTQSVTATRGNRVIKLIIGQKTAWVNGKAVILDVPPRLMDNTTMVPLRFVAESLDLTVTWDGTKNTVYVSGYKDFSSQRIIIDGKEIASESTVKRMFDGHLMIIGNPLFNYLGGQIRVNAGINWGSIEVIFPDRIITLSNGGMGAATYVRKTEGARQIWAPFLIDTAPGVDQFLIDSGYFEENYGWQYNWDRENNTLYITTLK